MEQVSNETFIALLEALCTEFNVTGQLVDAKDGTIIYQVEKQS